MRTRDDKIRVRLIRTTDTHTILLPGDEGTILSTDDADTVHVKWDRGPTLGLIEGEDEWEVLA